MKLAVIVCNYGAARHIGANPETEVRTFDFSPEALAFLEHEAQFSENQTITLAIHKEPQS